MKSFRTYQLALELHRSSQSLKLKGSARDQFERALLSVVLNLSEGSAKPTEPDRKRFYSIAMGSLRAFYYPHVAERNPEELFS